MPCSAGGGSTRWSAWAWRRSPSRKGSTPGVAKGVSVRRFRFPAPRHAAAVLVAPTPAAPGLSRPLPPSLERTGEQSSDEKPAEQDVDDEGRQSGHERSRHLDVVERCEAAGEVL